MRFDIMRNTVLGLTALGLAVGCGPVPDDSLGEHTAAVEGRVDESNDDTGNDGTDGWIVTALRVDGEGHTTVAGGPVETDAQGRYALDVSLGAQVHDGSIVIQAEHETRGEASVLLDGPFEAGSRRTAAPIDGRGSVEVRIYLEARASGAWPDRCSSADLRAMISAEIAAAYEETEPAAEDAAAFAAALQAWSETLVEAGGEAAFSAFKDARARARATLDAELHAAGDAAQRDAALEAYLAAEAAAYADAGFAPEDEALAAQARVDAFIAAGADMTAEAHARVVSRLEQERASLVGALAAQWLALMQAGDDALAELAEAQATLTASLSATAESGADSKEEARQAWAEFRAEVRATVESRADGQRQQAYGAVIEALDAARDGLQSALDDARQAAPSASAELVVTAYVAYQGQATAEAHVGTLVTLGGENEITAQAAIEALAALWAAGC